MARRDDRPRVALFGSGGPQSLAALQALDGACSVVAVVVPAFAAGPSLRAAIRAARRRRAGRPFVRLARRLRVPVHRYRPAIADRVAATLTRVAPDVICVAGFPYLLRPGMLAIPRWGAVNVHPSLLPRHRGPAPLFSTYVHDDRLTGVTVHWMDEGADTGPIVFQESIPLARGRPLAELYDELAARGARLLVRTVEAMATGSAPRIPQDEPLAPAATPPNPASLAIDFTTWDAERVWHLVAGLGGRGPSLLHGADGRPIVHGRAIGFTRAPHPRRPGTIERSSEGWRVFCRDGVVVVARLSLRDRVIALARRIL